MLWNRQAARVVRRAVADFEAAFALWLGIALGGFIDGGRLVYGARRRDRRTVRFESVKDAGGGVAAYLATYLLPFITTPSPTAGEIAAYIVYFSVVFIVPCASVLSTVGSS